MLTNTKRVAATLFAAAGIAATTSTMASPIKGSEMVPVNGIRAEIAQSEFIASPGETVNVPLTVHVGKAFDGRVSITQSRELERFSGTHWASGVYTNCSAQASARQIALGYKSQPLTITYTHQPGESRDHTLMLTVATDAPKGTHEAAVIVKEGNSTYRLPFTVTVR